MYVPVVYILMTGKTEELYFEAIQQVIRLSDWNLDPGHVSCDFEAAFINTLRQQFPDADIRGCYFHFCQAILRYLKKPDNRYSKKFTKEIFFELECCNLLTVCNPEEITTKALPYLRERMLRNKHDPEFTRFSNYITSYWLKYKNMFSLYAYMQKVGSGDRYYVLKNRTNNPLESYNGRLGQMFPRKPSSLKFWIDMKKEIFHWKNLIQSRNGRIRSVPPPQDAVMPLLPDDYDDFFV